MKKRNFNMLENFEVPESWIENAINAKPAPQKKSFYLNPRYTRFIGIAASLVLAAGMPMSTLLANNNSSLISPAFAKTNSHLLSENIKNPADTTDDGIIFTNPPETKNGVQATVPSETKNGVQATVPSEIKNRVHATEPPEITNEPAEQQIGTAHNGTQESGNQASNNDRPERREQSNQTQQSNTRETPKPTTPTKKPKNSEKEQAPTSNEEPVTTPPSNDHEKYTSWDTGWEKAINVPIGAGGNGSNNKPSGNYLGEPFTNDITITVPKGFWEENPLFSRIECNISGVEDDNDTKEIEGTLDFNLKTQINTFNVNLSKYYIIPTGTYNVILTCYDYNDDVIHKTEKYGVSLDNSQYIELSIE